MVVFKRMNKVHELLNTLYDYKLYINKFIPIYFNVAKLLQNQVHILSKKCKDIDFKQQLICQFYNATYFIMLMLWLISAKMSEN